jgi:hypothetical protein
MKLFNLLWVPVVGLAGTSYISQADSPPPQPIDSLKAWKVQPVAMPTIDPRSAHQALLSRQQQLAGKNFTCDCNGCRLAAQQVGVTLN